MWMAAFYFGSGTGGTTIVESVLLSVPPSPILKVADNKVRLAGNELRHTIAVADDKETLTDGSKNTII